MQEQKLPGTNKIQILGYSSSLSFGKCCQFLLDYPSFKNCNCYLSGAGFCSCSRSVLFKVHCVSFTLKTGPSTCKPKAIFHAAILFFFYLNSWLCCRHIASNPEGHTVNYIKRKKRQNIYNGYLEAKWNYRLKVLATEKVEHLKQFKFGLATWKRKPHKTKKQKKF